MKTRQQKLAEERAGHPPSPPQKLEVNPRRQRRAREKTRSAVVAAGSVVSAEMLAGAEKPQALLRIWADAALSDDNPTHQFAIPSARVPEFFRHLERICNQGEQNSFATSSTSAQVTPSLSRSQFALMSPPSRIEQELRDISPQMTPQTAPARVVSPFQQASPRMEPPAPSYRVEQLLQETSRPVVSHMTPASTKPLSQKTSRPKAPHAQPARAQSTAQEILRLKKSCNSPPASVEEVFQQTSHSIKFPCVERPIPTMPLSVPPARPAEQSVTTSDRNVIEKQTLDQEMSDKEFGVPVQSNLTEPVRSTPSHSQGQSAHRSTRRKEKAVSRNPMVPLPVKRNLEPVPSYLAAGNPAIFRNNKHLPVYTADGHALYGPVKPSEDHLNFQPPDKPLANEGSDMSRSRLERFTRPTHSVKRRFGFSQLSPVSEGSESAPQAQAQPIQTNSTQAILFPSRNLNRMMNKRKRWTSPDIIPNPKGKIAALSEAGFYGGDEDDGVLENQPGKVRRTSQSRNFSSQVAGSLGKSRPYTGQQPISKTPTRITNSTGTFKVPSPGDDNWSESESEDEVSQAASQPSAVNHPGATSRPQFTAYEEWLQTASPTVRAAVGRMEVNPNAAGHAVEMALDNPEPTGRRVFNAYEDWCETATPAVTAALEQMEVHFDIAGAAFKMGLGNYLLSEKGIEQMAAESSQLQHRNN